MSELPNPAKSKQNDYFVREKFILKISGLSIADNESILYKVYSHLGFLLFNLPYPFLAYSGLFRHNFDAAAEIVAFSSATLLGVSIVMATMINRKKMRVLLNNLEKTPFLPDAERLGAKEEILITNWFLVKNKQSTAFYVAEIICVGCGLLFTFVKSITSSDPQTWKFAFGPLTVLNVTDRVNFEISWFYQNVVICSLASKTFPILVILYGTLSYFCLHLQILQQYLRTMGTNNQEESIKDGSKTCKSESLSASNRTRTHSVSWKHLRPAVARAVSYHLKILEIISDWEDIFSLILLSMFLGVLGILCVLLYAVSLLPLQDPRAVTLLVTAATVSVLPLPICYWGEQVAHESEEVAKAAYEANFVGADLRFQNGLIMILNRSQRTVRLKAGKFVETSMVTFGWILRTSFSFFMVIRNVNMEE